MSEKLSADDQVLADALGRVISELREEWRREMLAVAAEARGVVLEVKLASAEALLERHDAQGVERLRAISGGKRD